MSDLDAGMGVSVPVSVPTNTQVSTPTLQPFVPQLHLLLSLPFAVFALVVLVRAFPWAPYRLERKPLSCDVCMAFWATFALGFGLSWFTGAHWSWSLLHLLPAPGAAILLLAVHKWLTAPRELPLFGDGPGDVVSPRPTAPERKFKRK